MKYWTYSTKLKNIPLSIAVLMLFLSACQNDEEAIQKPELSTSPIVSITGNSAISGGTITFDGGSEITTRGVCWLAGSLSRN